MERLAKVISKSGFCSRREAERLIIAGSVKVDGMIVNCFDIPVNSNCNIEVLGRSIATCLPESRLWTYYKPSGLITTHKDPQNRQTVFSSLKGLPRVISVGRLDLNSEGLLLLTNNGNLARHLELPKNKLVRTYKVRAYGNVEAIKKVQFPITIDKITYNPKSIKLTNHNAKNSWFEVVLCEGKNREIRKIFEYFSLSVNRLIRTTYGPFQLDNLKPGQYYEQHQDTFSDFIL
ncbi:MAG: pseudouridine synthase [Rickettsiaceae bacterium]|nr:MAG: pseudouridine synthase [Rickettsiaceae bacterium]